LLRETLELGLSYLKSTAKRVMKYINDLKKNIIPAIANETDIDVVIKYLNDNIDYR